MLWTHVEAANEHVVAFTWSCSYVLHGRTKNIRQVRGNEFYVQVKLSLTVAHGLSELTFSTLIWMIAHRNYDGLHNLLIEWHIDEELRRKKSAHIFKTCIYCSISYYYAHHFILLVVMVIKSIGSVQYRKTKQKNRHWALYLTKLSTIFVTLMDKCTVYVQVYW